MNRRQRPLVIGVATVLVVVVLTGLGYDWFRQSRMTAAKVQQYLTATDLSSLTGKERAEGLDELARRINALSAEERRGLRIDRAWESWFRQMSEEEKGRFIEATMPTGIKNMIAAFESLPEAKRKATLDEALKRLRAAHELPVTDNPFRAVAINQKNGPPLISRELEQRMRVIGLKRFYADSSAQTKAEAAPLLEEIQRLMESGAVLY